MVCASANGKDSNSIEFSNFVKFLEVACRGTPHEKGRLVFKMFDIDNDNSWNESERGVFFEYVLGCSSDSSNNGKTNNNNNESNDVNTEGNDTSVATDSGKSTNNDANNSNNKKTKAFERIDLFEREKFVNFVEGLISGKVDVENENENNNENNENNENTNGNTNGANTNNTNDNEEKDNNDDGNDDKNDKNQTELKQLSKEKGGNETSTNEKTPLKYNENREKENIGLSIEVGSQSEANGDTEADGDADTEKNSKVQTESNVRSASIVTSGSGTDVVPPASMSNLKANTLAQEWVANIELEKILNGGMSNGEYSDLLLMALNEYCKNSKKTKLKEVKVVSFFKECINFDLLLKSFNVIPSRHDEREKIQEMMSSCPLKLGDSWLVELFMCLSFTFCVDI